MALSKETRQKIVDLYKQGVTNKEIMDICGISLRTIYVTLAKAGVGGKFQTQLTLTNDAARWAMEHDDINAAIEELINEHISRSNLSYSEIEGGSKKRKNSEQKFPIAKSRVVQETEDFELDFRDEDGSTVTKKVITSYSDHNIIEALAKTAYSEIEGRYSISKIIVSKLTEDGKTHYFDIDI